MTDIEAVLKRRARWRIVQGDAQRVLPELPDRSVDDLVLQGAMRSLRHGRVRL